MTYKVLLIVILLFPGSAFAQDSLQPPYPADTSTVEVRTADGLTLDSLSNEEVFKYEQVAENPESFMSRLQRWLFQLIQLIGNNKWASLVIRFIFFTIFALVLIGLINQLLGGNLTSSFSSKKAGQALSLDLAESELSTTNYDDLLNQALSNQNYRDAVRILYLKALQELNERKLISWKPDKTNHDYLRELGSHPSSSFFDKLTTYYEYVEYGDFKIQKPGFDTVEEVYLKFQSQTES